jgi:hypothetical protein
MRYLKKVAMLLSLFCLLTLTACGGGGGNGGNGDSGGGNGGNGGGSNPPTHEISSAKEITSYTINGIAASIDQGTKLIVGVLPYGTDITKLDTTYTTTGTSVTIGNTTLLNPTETTTLNFTEAITIKVKALDGSENVYTAEVIVAANIEKAITSYSVTDYPAAVVNIDEFNGTISVILPYNAPRTDLAANFTTTGARVQVGETVQTAGVTKNDFTNPVTYTVYAADGSTKNYAVTVANAAKDTKSIISYAIKGYPAAIVSIDEFSGAISVTLPHNTTLTNLAANFTTTGEAVKIGEAAQVSGETTNDFTSPVTYTVYAADRSTKNYTVTVVNAAEDTKSIISYGIKGYPTAIINLDEVNGKIVVTLPYGVSLLNLVADFTTTGAAVKIKEAVQETGVSKNDFVDPIIYTVYAADKSTKDYTVTITNALKDDKLITSYAMKNLSSAVVMEAPNLTL